MVKKSSSESLMLVCVIYGKEFLDRILEAFLEIGISGATVMQSQGMGHILSRKVPLFSGFKELMETGGPYNYTVISVINDPKLVDRFVELVPSLKEGDFSKGVLFTVPISRFVKFDDLATEN